MDYRHITSQPEYSYDALTPENKDIINAISSMVDALDTFLANEYMVDEASTYSERMVAGFAEEIIEGAKEWLELEKLGWQISLIDSQHEDDES